MGKYIRGRSKIEETRSRLSKNLEAEQQLQQAADIANEKSDELLVMLEEELANILHKLEIISRVKDIEVTLKKRLRIIEPFIQKLKQLKKVEEVNKEEKVSKEKDVESIEHLEDF